MTEKEDDGRNYVWYSKKVADRSDGRIIEEISVCFKSNEPFDKLRDDAIADFKELTKEVKK